MYQIELYVPLRDNQGQEIDRNHWDRLRNRIIAWFNGFTVFKAKGRWENQTEHVAVYRILSDRPRETTKAIVCGMLAAYVKEHWRQETVLWTLSAAETHYN